jgi:hypothetical protein
MGLYEDIEAAKGAEAALLTLVNERNAERDTIARDCARQLAAAQDACRVAGNTAEALDHVEATRAEGNARLDVAREAVNEAHRALRAARDRRNELLKQAGKIISGAN